MQQRLMLAGVCAFALTAAFVVVPSSPAAALTMKECSGKYKAAKAAGTTLKWNDFRAKECGADATAEPEASADNDEEPAAPTAKAPRGVMFPKSVSSKYASESAGKARMHTCVDAYHVNKDKGTLNGLKWIQKGGGYYSLCNAQLKKG
jgi:hypothetical protein